jgi:hypothetical protein
MKLLIITASKGFDKNIVRMLKKAGVKHFSFQEVNGYEIASEHHIEDQWFATEGAVTESVLFYAFVPKENSEKLLHEVNQFNAVKNVQSHVHAAVVAIEKMNNLNL